MAKAKKPPITRFPTPVTDALKRNFPDIKVPPYQYPKIPEFFKNPPLKVSPLIRTARWLGLFMGIAYGWKKWNYLYCMETEQQQQFQTIRDKGAAFKKWKHTITDREGMGQLYKEVVMGVHQENWDVSDLPEVAQSKPVQ